VEAVLLIALTILFVVFYFLPALIADKRKIGPKGTIGWLNFFFGWTVLGWIGLLIWAVVDPPKAPEYVASVHPHLRDCPACYSKIDPRATICPHCRTAVEALPHESGYSPGTSAD